MDNANTKSMEIHLSSLVMTTLISIAIQTWSTYQVYYGKIEMSHFLITHVLVVALLGVSLYRRHRKKLYLNLHLNLLIQTLFVGVFGTVISLISTIRYSIYSRDAEAFSDWLDNLFPDEETKSSETLYERISFGLDDKSGEYVESYHDLMIYGTTLNKQMLIARATRYFKPSFAPILLMALQDDDNIIRVQAAASIATIEDSFYKKYKEHEQKVDEAPDNYMANQLFALFCIEYIGSGILGEKRTESIAEISIQTLHTCMELRPGDENPRFLLGRLHLDLGQPEHAYTVLKQSVDTEAFLIPELVHFYIRALYELKRIRELRSFCVKYLEGNIKILYVDTELDDCICMWASGLITADWEAVK